MTYFINRLTFAPTHCDNALLMPHGCEVIFWTSEHGEVEINTGSASAEPTEIFNHVRRAGAELVQQLPQYADAVASMMPE